MKKDLRYFLDINYPIEINEIPKNEGGGVTASIPVLGKYAFRGDGETIDEAIENLNNIKEYLFKKYLDQNIPIPEPRKRMKLFLNGLGRVIYK